MWFQTRVTLFALTHLSDTCSRFPENADRRVDKVPSLPEASQLRFSAGRVRACAGWGQKSHGAAGHPQRGARCGAVAARAVHGG